MDSKTIAAWLEDEDRREATPQQLMEEQAERAAKGSGE